MTASSVQRAPAQPFASTRRGRLFIEHAQAYAFIFPATLLIFIFGLFPIGFAFFVSLHRWRRFPDEYFALGQYTRALGDFAYVLFFWLALGAFAYAAWLLWKQWRDDQRGVLALLPGALNAAALLLFVQWFSLALPIVLNIPQRIRGQERVPGLFMNELFLSFQFPEVIAASNLMGLAIAAALLGCAAWWLLNRSQGLDANEGLQPLAQNPNDDEDKGLKPLVRSYRQPFNSSRALLNMTIAAFLTACGVLTLMLTASAVQTAVVEAGTGEPLGVWVQALLISAGVGLLALAWWLWTRAGKRESDRRYLMQLAAAAMLAASGYILIAELPRVLVEADPTMLQGYGITALFVIFTVPLQLGLGLGLAYMLFQNIKGKAFFRVAYFLPYIMPFVATSIVFNVLFSHRPASPINQLFISLGLPIQKWLQEPTGVLQLIFGDGVPDALSGPSLALIVIIIYTVWTYVGYCTVVFLAGLGNISQELYEAARIDGASGWAIFRHITLPLLSPTTFFLSLISIIGTFQAFTQIWIMRTPASQSSVDTVGVYIFETVRNTDPNMGYSAALSMVLFVVILIFTLIQNRIAGSRVFYG